ncbi:ATP-binding protein [Actinocrispum wychmicini]|uniref:Putative ATPase n=1 Tax=Actinocrispum wychmicini TaxID=1213861 RepID=A0A4R2J3C5_9PSEU|nr:tetratricopeptide repeat protein [Actinocrispum wychmicini]TCO50879.1 putative ATPase [Actinocrispum wychmicini]
MFSVLLLRAGQPVGVDELIGWMWPDGTAPENPAGALVTYRKRITAGLSRMADPPRIHLRNRTYLLEVDREEIDFHEFRNCADKARSATRHGDHTSAARILAAAVDVLWRGTPLPDLIGERAANWRQMAESEHLIPAHNALLHSLSALNEHEEVLRRIADLRLEIRTSLAMVKHRLSALHAVHRFEDAVEFFRSQYRRMMSERNPDEGDALRRFHDELSTRSRTPKPVVVSSPKPTVETPHLLPRDIADFTGREDVLRHLDTVTSNADGSPAPTVVVLSGQPGVGKTAVALHWAHMAASRFEGGQLYCDLNGFGEGEPVNQSEVVVEFLTALGFPADRIPSLAGRMAKLRSLLSGARALVVLDNARDSEHVRTLLECLSNCAVILTSRHRLRGLARTGAVGILLPPLTYAEGKSWLAKWLGSRADAEPTAASDLVALCGGIALALKIIVEHTHSRPRVALADFVEEMRSEPLSLGDHRDGPGGSVRAALEQSYRALNSAEQRLFRLFGANAGSDINVAAASALLGQDRAETKWCLDALVDVHLLTQPESRDRYRMHDLLRLYARELVERSDEQFAAEERLACFYLYSANNVDRIVFPQQRGVDLPPLVAQVLPVEFADEDKALKWAVRERANINAVLQRSATRGLHTYVSKLPSVIGEVFVRLGYSDDVAAALRMAIRSAQAVGNAFDEASWHGNLAFVRLGRRDFDSAMEHVFAARVIFERIDDPRGVAITDYYMSRVFVERGETARGIEFGLRALTALQRLENVKDVETIAMFRLAEAYRRAGNLDAAASFCRDALSNADRIGDVHTRGCVLGELGMIHLECGEYTEARGYLTRALEILGNNEAAQVGQIHQAMADIHFALKEYQSAERSARQALTFFRAARRDADQAGALRTIAEAVYRQARHVEAVETWMLALAIADTVGESAVAQRIRRRLAEVEVAVPDIPQERTDSLHERPITGLTR